MKCLGVLNKKTGNYLIFSLSKKFLRKGVEADMFALQNFSVPDKRTETRTHIFAWWTTKQKQELMCKKHTELTLCKDAMDLVLEKHEPFEEAAADIITDIVETFDCMISKMSKEKEKRYKEKLKSNLKQFLTQKVNSMSQDSCSCAQKLINKLKENVSLSGPGNYYHLKFKYIIEALSEMGVTEKKIQELKDTIHKYCQEKSMTEELKGKFRIKVKRETVIGEEYIAISPKDVQIVKTLINTEQKEEKQLIFCYGSKIPYVVNMSYEEYVTLSNSVEEEDE